MSIPTPPIGRRSAPTSGTETVTHCRGMFGLFGYPNDSPKRSAALRLLSASFAKRKEGP
jgi:hypothetical protein